MHGNLQSMAAVACAPEVPAKERAPNRMRTCAGAKEKALHARTGVNTAHTSHARTRTHAH